MLRIRSFCSLALSLPILACSNHPLPDRVTGYSSAELVEKLRCEAQEAVLFHIFYNGWRRAQHNYLRTTHTLKNIDKFNADNKEDLDEYNKIAKKYDDKINKLAKPLSSLNEKFDRAASTALTLEHRIKKNEWVKELIELYKKKYKENGRIVDSSNSSGIITEIDKDTIIMTNKELIILNGIFNKSRDDSSEIRELLKIIIERIAKKIDWVEGIVEDEELSDYRGLYQEKKKEFTILELKISSVRKLIRKLKKEKIEELYKEDPQGVIETKYNARKNESKKISSSNENEIIRKLFKFNNIKITIKLDFDITEINNASAGLKLLWPKLKKLGNISLNMSAAKDKTRKAKRVITTVSTFEELSDQNKLNCWDTAYTHQSNRARTYPIKGNVGIGELIDQYLEISESTSVPNADESFIDTLTFTTALKAGFNPTIELKKITPQILEGGLDFNAERTDIHEVTVQLKSHEPTPGEKVENLNILSLPDMNMRIITE